MNKEENRIFKEWDEHNKNIISKFDKIIISCVILVIICFSIVILLR